MGGPLDMEDELPLLEEEPVPFNSGIPESELDPTSEPMEMASAAASIDVITASTTTSAFRLPGGMAGPSMNTQSLTGLRGSVKGRGPGVGKGGSGKIFGQSITATNLGVVVDVSGSSHRFLAFAIDEIFKSFPEATLIMVVGCGMSDGTRTLNGGPDGEVPGKPRIIPYDDIESEKENNSLKRSVPRQMKLFYDKIGRKRADEMKNLFEQKKNLYYLYGGDIWATNFAFDFLLDQNADVIYWFADFADSIDDKIMFDLTIRSVSKRTKVITHNFTGTKVPPQQATLAKRTGGKTVEIVPGKKK